MAKTRKPQSVEAKLSELTVSPLNPRRTVDERKLSELADSMREKGLIQPPLARPAPSGGYEILCGSRRFGAAKLLGYASLEVRVRFDLDDDDDALEAMIVENDQREDLDPLEEADGYHALVERGHDVASIAKKLGRSESYVYGRLRLRNLGDEARFVFERELVPFAGAMLLAQLGLDGQREVLEGLAGEFDCWMWPLDGAGLDAWQKVDPVPVSTRMIRKIICRSERNLARAPWDVSDAELVPSAGACASCPKHTAAQAELFEAPKDDVCLDKSCWTSKLDASWAAKRAAAEANGATVLAGEEASKHISFGRVAWKSPLVSLDERIDVDADEEGGVEYGKEPTWRKALEEQGALQPGDVTLLRDEETGAVIEAVDRSSAWAALAERFPKTAKRQLNTGKTSASKGSAPNPYKDEQRQRLAKHKVELEVRRRVMQTLVGAIEDRGELDDDALRALVVVTAPNMSADAVALVESRRGLRSVRDYMKPRGEAIIRASRDMSRAQLLALVAELALAEPLSAGSWSDDPLRSRTAARTFVDLYHIDVAHHRREVKKTSKKPSVKKTSKKPSVKKASKKTSKKASKKPSLKKTSKKPSVKKASKKPSAKKASKKPSAKKASKKPSTKKASKKPSAKKASKKPSAKTTKAASKRYGRGAKARATA